MRKFNPKIYVLEKSLMFLWYSSLILGWVGSLKVRFPEMLPLNSVGNQPDSLGRMGSGSFALGPPEKVASYSHQSIFQVLWLLVSGEGFFVWTHFDPKCLLVKSTIHGPQSTKKTLAATIIYVVCLNRWSIFFHQGLSFSWLTPGVWRKLLDA